MTGNEQQQEQEELDEDEDLMVVGNVDKNDKCPYTLKDVSGGCEGGMMSSWACGHVCAKNGMWLFLCFFVSGHVATADRAETRCVGC